MGRIKYSKVIDESDKNDDDESEEQVKIIKREILIEGLYPTLVKRDKRKGK